MSKAGRGTTLRQDGEIKAEWTKQKAEQQEAFWKTCLHQQ